MEYAGFWRRVAAFLIDVVPITIVVMAVFYCCLGFDLVLQERADHPDDLGARMRFLVMRNTIRGISALVWLILCTVLEPTRLHGSFGKFILHIKVLDEGFQRVTLKRAFIRNFTKIGSGLALGIGCFWVAFTERKQGWHDIFADTVVVWDTCDDDASGERHA